MITSSSIIIIVISSGPAELAGPGRGSLAPALPAEPLYSMIIYIYIYIYRDR